MLELIEVKKYSKYLGFVVAVAVSVVIFLNRDKFIALGKYGYPGIFLISILGNATIVLPVPVVLTAFIGGGLFNPIWVAVLTALGASIGELTGYLAGFSGRAVVKDDERLIKIEKKMRKHGLWVLFLLAAIPNPLFDLAGIVAGISKIPVWKYLVIVFFGKCIKFLVFSYLGAGSVELIGKYFS